MTELILVAVLLTAAGCAWWLLGDLRTVPPQTGHRDSAASVSVIIPARNEERALPILVGSLRELNTEVAEILVVDDESEDATASAARSAGATVLVAADRPAGWTGKAWACHLGAHASSGDLLLFLDADTVLAPDALGGLLTLHERHGGLVSVQPFHRVVRAYEQFSAYFNVMSLLASAAFARGSARSSAGQPHRRPMAFGPCLLTKRSDYQLVGGHTVVRGEILDDVQLAAAYDRAGLPVKCAIGGQSIWMRSYPGGLRQLAAGWTKNIASGATAATTGPTLASVWWVGAHHAVAVGAILALVTTLSGVAVPLFYGHPALWAVAWVGVAGQLWWILRRIGSFRWWTWVLFPVPLLAFDLLFTRSAALMLFRRSVNWRGRTVALDRSGSTPGGV